MEEYDSVADIVQVCIMESGDFDRQLFIKLIEQMTAQDFNRYGAEIMHLRHYYDRTHGACVCDIVPFINEHPDMFWHLPQIDFDSPIDFRAL